MSLLKLCVGATALNLTSSVKLSNQIIEVDSVSTLSLLVAVRSGTTIQPHNQPLDAKIRFCYGVR